MSYVDERLPVYAKTQKRIGYGDITLRRDGDFAVVEIEHEGRTIEVIREHIDGNFCNTITCLGIEDAILGREEFAGVRA